jgi:uncharacterized membrane protein (Fun14 family)
MYIIYIGFLIRKVRAKSYILDIPYIHHVHPCSSIVSTGGRSLSTEIITSVSATLGGGFFGGLLFGYAIKKVVKLIAVIAGLFIAGLAYLQYQQIASFYWNRIEDLTSAALGNVTGHISTNQELATLAMSNFGIPLTGSMSAGFAVGFMKG